MHTEVLMQLSKEESIRKRIHNGSLMQTENSVTQDNCLPSLSKLQDAKESPFNPHLTTIKDSFIFQSYCISYLSSFPRLIHRHSPCHYHIAMTTGYMMTLSYIGTPELNTASHLKIFKVI